MSLTDLIGQTYLEQGRAVAQAAANKGQIWGGAIRSLGQIPQVMEQQKAAEQERQIRAQQLQMGQMQLDAAKRAQAGQAAVNGIVSQLVQQPNGTRTLDRQQLVQAMAAQNVPLDIQKSTLQALDDVDKSISTFAETRINHSADVAHAILSAHKGDEPITPDTLNVGLALAKANGLADDEDIGMVQQALAQGANPRQLLTQIRGMSEKYKDVNKPVVIPRGGTLASPTGETIATGQPAALTEPEIALQASGNDPTAALQALQAPAMLNAQRAQAAQTETARHNQADEAAAQGRLSVERQRLAQAAATAAGGAGQLTPEGLDLAATQYRVTGVMPAMGMGRTPERFAVINRAAEQAKLLGQTPAAAIQKQFSVKADANALKQLQTLSSTAEAAENKAVGQIGIISDLSAKVPRTQIPLINSAIIAGKINLLGDSNAQQLANAIQTFSNEYGKIIEGSTGSVSGSSDASRKAASKLVSAAMNPKTLQDSLALMQREMDLTLAGYDAAIQHVSTTMTGGEPGAARGAQPPAAPSTVAPVGRFNPATGKVEPISGR